ncbi:type II secretion system protein [Thomasclavelia cocleata]|nr:prepilin-type N-terminal cleavage/methylation domain-containing protein [Thomasclavelia cocleata]
MKRRGFTLIEMIFCISVILIILLLVIPNVISCLVHKFN